MKYHRLSMEVIYLFLELLPNSTFFRSCKFRKYCWNAILFFSLFISTISHIADLVVSQLKVKVLIKDWICLPYLRDMRGSKDFCLEEWESYMACLNCWHYGMFMKSKRQVDWLLPNLSHYHHWWELYNSMCDYATGTKLILVCAKNFPIFTDTTLGYAAISAFAMYFPDNRKTHKKGEKDRKVVKIWDYHFFEPIHTVVPRASHFTGQLLLLWT